MIAIWRDWSGVSDRISDRVATSLGLFAGYPAAFWRDSATGYSFLPSPRLAAPIRGWRPYHTSGDAAVLFNGRIDNSFELSASLGCDKSDPAQIFGLAVERWGSGAEHHIVGRYCAIVARNGELRLSRSPWDAPPLHYCQFEDQAIVASVPRVLLAAGMPRDLDRVKLADNLFFNLLDRERGFYAGGRKVPYGSIVTLTRSGARRHDWYDPDTIPPVRFKHDQDYVDKANALLAEATGKALAMSRKPAISLSGGLDSPLIADEVLRQLPVGAQLHSFTAVPDPDWDGITPPGSMGDERHFVARFSAEKPQLVAHFTANPGTGFDARWDEFFVAMGGAPNHLVNYQAYHGVWAGAQEAGCDAVLTGEFGNETYSNDGRWAYVEYLLKLRWKELALALKHRPGDKRSLLRKVAAMSVLRIMPRPVRRMVRAIRHAGATDLNRLVSMLPPAAARRAMRRAMAGGAVIDREWVASQQASNRMDYIWRDAHCGDVEQAFEQIYGLRWIDVSTYRPLVEFCMGLPTDQFLRGGVDRWLARRMAAGRLPEAQRSNRLLGWHNPDWHVRMTRRLPELRAKVLAMAADPELAGLLDTSRMAALLDDWPAETPLEMERWMPRAAGLTRGFLTARFVQHVSGRNRP